MSERLRVAIIGMGGAGLAQVAYFREIPGVEVAQVVDPHAEQVPERLGKRRLAPVPATRRLDDVLSDPSIDLVSVCTPDSTHADYCVAVLEARKHLLCEKPLADNEENCVRTVEAWKRSGKVGAVQHQFRFEPWFHKAAELVRAGAIGRVVAIHGDYIHNLRDRSRLYHPWRFAGPDAHAPMPAAGVHFLDLFRWLVGSEIVEITARGNHIAFPGYPDNDCIESHFRFANGTIGRVTVTIGVEHPIHFPIRVFGTEGTLADGFLIRENSAERVFENPRPKRVPVRDRWGIRYRMQGWRIVYRVPRQLLGHLKRGLVKALKPQATADFAPVPLLWRTEYEHREACIRSVTNVVEAIREGKQPLVTLEEAARSCAVAFAATRSYREGGRPVEISGVAFGSPSNGSLGAPGTPEHAAAL
jgi:myo-inositol 2-dehydrogenase/D-chiro-inositol 1-dehydrogenase/scyllo-inositol 2-dehydrogenase (NAD+)